LFILLIEKNLPNGMLLNVSLSFSKALVNVEAIVRRRSTSGSSFVGLGVGSGGLLTSYVITSSLFEISFDCAGFSGSTGF